MENNSIIELRKIERELLNSQVATLLLKMSKEIIVSGVFPDVDLYARKIVAHCREQIIS
jgi:hypothetical protein